jgi:inosine-uridine nucleoside N-ribohydrolase
MRDTALITLLRAIILAGLEVRELTSVAVKQANAPLQGGANTTPTVYLQKLYDHAYANPKKRSVWDEESETMIQTQSQVYESTYQINGFVIIDPTAENIMTASDLTTIVSQILQSDVAIQSFRAQGVELYRIDSIRNPYFLDDKNQFEAAPSFDVVLIHTDSVIAEVDSTDVINSGIYPI